MTIFKPLLFIVVLATATVCVAGDASKKDAAKEDMKKLQGTWQVSKFVDHSEEPAAPDEIKHFTFEFKADRLTIREDKGATGRAGKYTLDPSKTPKSIDLDMGDPAGGVSEGIYKLDGDELTICVVAGTRNGKASPRPAEFKASKGAKYSLFVLKKVKK